ncbi:MAG: hypothetical protein GWM98_15410 [Nitrospinaceae bacterium]|nr:hypothetical protein [Nitrospinaceae bacterium]NIR55612.1 hypothetical protein [Nitrospinaceae bacterium]NIS86046.1 hypothetical protein [Nitrospinaceae bacterium]NIT82889.1 hypothetical protein [Nitrospinaceae bacterium]NIU45094.1 hypothetical protein [Nitrospinaceae bacterium]
MPAKRDVVVRVGGDTSVLQEEMTRGSKSVKGFGGEVRSQLGGVVKSLAKVAAGATAAGSALTLGLVQKGREAVRELGKMSRVANAGSQEFQRLSFAARQLGIDQDKFGDILKDVNDRVGDFLTTGGGPMADFFEKIAPRVGVTAEQFRNLSGPQALQLFITSLERANITQAETTFFLEAMASDLTLLLPLFRNNGAMAKAAGEEFDKFGATLNAIEIKQVKEADIAMQNFVVGIEAVSKRIVVELAPALKFIGDGFKEAVKQSGGFKDALRETFDTGVAVVAVLLDGIDSIKIGFKVLEVAAAGFAAFFNNIMSAVVSALSGQVKKFIDATTAGLNDAIETMNRFLGTDFGKLQAPQMPLIFDSIIAAGPESTRILNEVNNELVTMVAQFNKESTGEAFFKAMNRMTAKARQAADAVKEINENVQGTFTPPPDVTSDDDQREVRDAIAESSAAALEKQLQKRLEILRQAGETELNLEIEMHLKRLAELQTLEDRGLITDQERMALRENLEKKHQERLTQIKVQSMTQLERFNSMSWANQTATVVGEMVNMTRGVARENKTLFEINKQAATAEAIIQGFMAINRTMGAYPYPLSLVMAGLQAAASAAQVAAIQKQTFSGASFSPSVAGSTAAAPVTPVGGDGSGETQNVFINLRGQEVFGEETIRELISSINEATKDGARLQVVSQ